MILAVDFDGTIVADQFPEIGEPLFGAIAALKQLRENGNQLILWTCREDSPARKYLSEAVDFCRSHGLEFDAVNCNASGNPYSHLGEARKVYADFYIDDKSLLPQWNAYFG
jgi:ribonucleotide monophosphatase NagD (HAD superfamily)